jgi:hypothetical protein
MPARKAKKPKPQPKSVADATETVDQDLNPPDDTPSKEALTTETLITEMNAVSEVSGQSDPLNVVARLGWIIADNRLQILELEEGIKRTKHKATITRKQNEITGIEPKLKKTTEELTAFVSEHKLTLNSLFLGNKRCMVCYQQFAKSFECIDHMRQTHKCFRSNQSCS